MRKKIDPLVFIEIKSSSEYKSEKEASISSTLFLYILSSSPISPLSESKIVELFLFYFSSLIQVLSIFLILLSLLF